VLEGRGDEAPAAEWALFLTHSHADHIVHFDELSEMTANQYAPAGETYGGAQSVREGDEFYIGPWRLTALETAGHSPAGMSYLLETSTVPIAFVGDALFCYSIGKVNPARYQSALSAIQEKILGLPDETILCPGHGPLTSVAFEKRHNPFFV